jgi:hypothetical protein
MLVGDLVGGGSGGAAAFLARKLAKRARLSSHRSGTTRVYARRRARFICTKVLGVSERTAVTSQGESVHRRLDVEVLSRSMRSR